LNQLAVGSPPRRTGTGAAAGSNQVVDEAKLVGSLLYDLIIPDDVRGELRRNDLFLEVGSDEALLEYPWELLYDGEDFLCLKHRLGRFVNVANPTPSNLRQPEQFSTDGLSILSISVPRPQPRPGGTAYEPLPAAEAETQAIVDTLAPLGNVVKLELLCGREATFDAVYTAIRDRGRYHIVHFNGHAFFNNQNPYGSGLVLFDQDMTTGQIVNFFKRKPPVFFFMNACETAATNSNRTDWRSRYDIFGLARAFLDTGAYLLGSRWKIGDTSAKNFAEALFKQLADFNTLGDAVKAARIKCREASSPNDLAWASYLFYGDPRVCFRLVS
jgi:CHAT domain-containing protein